MFVTFGELPSMRGALFDRNGMNSNLSVQISVTKKAVKRVKVGVCHLAKSPALASLAPVFAPTRC